MNIFTEPHFQTDEAARIFIEAIRWPNGPVCPHCQENERRYQTKKEGRWRCGNPACRKDYTVTTKTVMESSHIGLHKWLMAFYLLCASKKGMSSHQLMRSLDLTYKSAWFLSMRIREAMREGGLIPPAPLGGEGRIVEADETYLWKTDEPMPRSRGRIPSPTKKGRSGPADKRAIVALVERHGRVRTFHPGAADKVTVQKIVEQNVDRESRLHTDESRLYGDAVKHVISHETVKHSIGEYVRGDVHTNSAEGFFSIFKRGMRGIYQHCDEKHLHRYLAEYDFRYNRRTRLGWDDKDRTRAAIRNVGGKRLTYRKPDGVGSPA